MNVESFISKVNLKLFENFKLSQKQIFEQLNTLEDSAKRNYLEIYFSNTSNFDQDSPRPVQVLSGLYPPLPPKLSSKYLSLQNILLSKSESKNLTSSYFLPRLITNFIEAPSPDIVQEILEICEPYVKKESYKLRNAFQIIYDIFQKKDLLLKRVNLLWSS